ncbi:MAG: DNA helicase RecQ [Cytophagales bacterium]|nr:MAG: DNA helicase RecQ [Cytophagales bacterium]
MVEEEKTVGYPILKEKLKEVFGYGQFRGNQEEIINSIFSKQHTFVIMPTGAGKSLCYQLPAIIKEGTAIVISPLIALMKNQVDQLNAIGVNAQFLNSTLNKSEMTRVKKGVLNGETKLLYVAPESLTKETNVDFLKKANISFVAVDEAHCISEWGHDFRPEYRKIRTIVDNLGNLPLIALTATATPKVQQDIQKNLLMESANTFKSSFNRPNLYYEVRPKVAVKKQLIKYIKSKTGQSGIIYCLSRKKVEEVCEFLQVNDIKAAPYHAGLESDIRMNNQDAFLNEEVDIIVATIAFGMGIDKPDVRFVIHYDVPKSLEGYYQETGRAGRDGLEGDCIMFYSPNDILKLEKFNKDKTVTERENARQLLNEMMAYATSAVCRRKQLLNYFGEYLEKDCGFCDNCIKERESYEVQNEAVIAMQVVLKIDQRFAAPHVADILTGTKSDYVMSYNHDQLLEFGKGNEKEVEKDNAYWQSLLRQLVMYGLLDKDIDNYGVLKISEKGQEYLDDPYTLTLYKDHDYSSVTEEQEEKQEIGHRSNGVKAYDPTLFDLLKNLCKRVAKEAGLPPYAIFQEPSLEEMATTYPVTKDELLRVNGVGKGKVDKFGQPFIDLIAKYVEENDIETANEVVVKSAINKSKVKIFIIQQIDKKVDLEDISEAKNISMSEILDEIESICYSGTKLNLDYYIDQMMEADRQDIIYDYFMTAESDNIQLAMESLAEDDFSEEEVRLMRIKFLSEVAN